MNLAKTVDYLIDYYADIKQRAEKLEKKLAELSELPTAPGAVWAQCVCGKSNCPDLGKPYHSIRYLYRPPGGNYRHVPKKEARKLMEKIANRKLIESVQEQLDQYSALLNKGISATTSTSFTIGKISSGDDVGIKDASSVGREECERVSLEE